jgi:sn-glycerol 3-phosphate transport system ATP-binding protein
MNAGVAEQIGTPADVYRRPASTFVAGFIGSPAMNFLPGRVTTSGDAVELPGRERLSAGKPIGPAGTPVTVGIRPEHLALAPGSTGSHALHVVVELVEMLGADTLVHGRLGDSPDLLLARLPGSTAVRIGDRLAFRVPPEELHLFDAESGKTLPRPRGQ